MSIADSIPVLDLSSLYNKDSESRNYLAKEFFNAYSTAGFSYVINHGIDENLINELFLASKKFHQLPEKAKLEIMLDKNHRGYIPINSSTDVNSKLVEVNTPNQSESFILLREDDPSSPDFDSETYLAGSNQWPDLPGFRETVSRYNSELEKLAKQLIELVALSLGESAEKLTPYFSPATTWLRLLHYPPSEPQSGEFKWGSAPHTDFGCLTILCQDDMGGLQVKSNGGQWIDVPKLPGSFVMNVGDMLHRWSNGLLKSTPHRVINTSGKERYSCPFFFDPHVSTNITPLEKCVDVIGESKFETINFGTFLKSELEAGYEQHQ